ncbi:MAG: hypothetical protein M0Q91_13500 [Methanoregula sp.]|jgi:hypothetical protein|nr:hypothetical protein [Methanoregula sp.]
MQLPRGTFRYIKKDTKLGGILDELQLMKFSGICTISFGSAQGSLVFKSGKRILAEFRNIAGDTAWDEFQKIIEENVDASISAMDDTQIELSLEFNKSCRIGKGGKPEQSPHSPAKTGSVMVKESPPVPPGAAVAKPIKSLQKHPIQERASVGPSVTFETVHIPDPPKTQVSKIQGNKIPFPPPADNRTLTIPQKSPEFSQKTGEMKKPDDEAPHPADIESRNFDSDIDTIETMDVDIITSKIRGECKTLIKQLRLEHLTER